MNADEARAITERLGLRERIAALVSAAPPIPQRAADLWRRALRQHVERHGDDD